MAQLQIKVKKERDMITMHDCVMVHNFFYRAYSLIALHVLYMWLITANTAFLSLIHVFMYA